MFLDLVRNAGSYIIFFTYCALMALPVLILLYLPAWGWAKALYWMFVKMTAKVLLLATFLPVTYQGVNDIPPGPVIFAANHQSTLDIVLVASILGQHRCTWLAWSEFFKYPLLGQVLSRTGIPVYPREPEYAGRRGAVAAAVKKLQEGTSIIIFPEGGRYVDTTIHPFYSGCAAMAKLSGAPVVPLFISGTGIAMPPHSHTITRYPLMITVGKPMVCGPDESVAQFKERVEQWFIELNWRRNYLLDRYGIRLCNGHRVLPDGEYAIS